MPPVAQVTEITLNRSGGKSLGILLAVNPNTAQGGQIVAKLTDGGLAHLDGGLLPGDVITHINDTDVQISTKAEVFAFLGKDPSCKRT